MKQSGRACDSSSTAAACLCAQEKAHVNRQAERTKQAALQAAAEKKAANAALLKSVGGGPVTLTPKP